jgi:hypothetical protein
MALKKPLVLTNGEIEQLQPSDSIAEVDLLNLTNAEATPIVKGAPVYVFGNDSVKKAKGDAVGTTPVIGLVAQTSITNAVAGGIQMNGVLAATTGEWDVVTGGTGGLVANTKYYLSAATAGMLTTTAPATGFSQRVGIGVSTTEMLIDPKVVIKL